MVNRDLRKVIPGETLSLHPEDRLKIIKLSTSLPFGLGVRLFSGADFDVNACRFEQISIAALLPRQDIFEQHQFRIQVKYRNKDIGHMLWNIRPYPEDWLDQVEKAAPENRLEILKRAFKLFPSDRAIWRRMLDEYKSQKQWGLAAELIENSIKKEGPAAEDLHELLKVYIEMSNRKGIAATLRRLIELDPEDLDSRTRLAEFLENQEKWKGAIQHYEAVLAYIKDQDAVNIYKNLGYLYSKTDNSKKAVFYYLKAVELDKKDANLYFNLSAMYQKMGQSEKADSYLARAAELKSGDLDSRLELARRFIKKGDLSKAEKYISDILKKSPKSLEALVLMAQVMEKKGSKKDLKRTFEKILSIKPDYHTVLYNLGVMEYEAGNFNQSRDLLVKYIRLKPKDADPHEILLDIYQKHKKSKKAFDEARALVELAPKKVSVYRFIFDYLMSRADYKQTISFMLKGVKANPEQINLRESLAIAYLKAGKDTLAASQIEKILKVKPGQVNLLLDLAKLKERRGDFAGALEVCKRILDIEPENEEAENFYLRLRLKAVHQKEKGPGAD
jgi:tetratricopeptide (TPR) repeat protein